MMICRNFVLIIVSLYVAVLVLGIVLFIDPVFINGSSKTSLRKVVQFKTITSGTHPHVDFCKKSDSRIICETGEACQSKLSLPGTYCDPTIHVILSVDVKVLDGLIALIESIRVHSSAEARNITIHIVGSTDDSVVIQDRIACSLELPPRIQVTDILCAGLIKYHRDIDFKSFNLPSGLRELIKINLRKKRYLKSPANFARFLFSELFPSLSRAIYLDVDTIVRQDLGQLWDKVISSDKLLMAVPRSYYRPHLSFSKANFMAMKEEIGLSKDIIQMLQDVAHPSPDLMEFNAGVLGINLEKWRKNNITREAEYWMKRNYEYSLWGLGTQPIMYILSYNDWDHFDKRWNVELRKYTKQEVVNSAYLLHWNALKKPWKSSHRSQRSAKHDMEFHSRNIWKQYHRKACNGKGKCIDSLCHCTDPDYSQGKLCDS